MAALPAILRWATRGADSSLGYSAVARPNERAWVGTRVHLAREYFGDFAILLVSLQLALHFRRVLPFGSRRRVEDWWHDPTFLLVVVAALAIAHALRPIGDTAGAGVARRRFLAPFGAVALAMVGMKLVQPTTSPLLLGYFLASATPLLLLVVPWPVRWASGDRRVDLVPSIRKLIARRSLLRLWVTFAIRSRYEEAVLGILWVVLLPLASALVMSVVFAQLMRGAVGDVPFIAFLLAGIIPWNYFRLAVTNGSRSLVQSMGLMNQIYFPREIIVIASLGEAIVDTAVMFVSMLVIDAVVGIWPHPWYLMMPVIFLIQTIFILGLMLALSWLGALIRDVPNILQLALQVIFYMCAVIYPGRIIPARYRWILDINPIAILIGAYRDVLIYHRAPNWNALLFPTALGIGTLIFGYRLFKAKEDTVADLL